MQQLKAEFLQVKRLRGMSGFGWDDETKLVVAGDEQWTQLGQVCSRIDSLDLVLTMLVTERCTDQKVEDNAISDV